MIDLPALAASLPRGEGRVHATVIDGVAEVVLAHPARRNAFTPHMMVDLGRLDVSGARCILLRGAGESFCSGGDLGAVRQHLALPGAGRALASFMADAIARLSRQAPIVGCAEGHALGGGAELLAACDIVVAAPTAEVGFVQARLGVSPGFGGGGYLARRVGPGRARAILVAAERLPAARALALGLVDEIADPPLPRAR
ncbi:MAG: enoyl-CoA hydratase/isomerase family protein, partial [Deltaproteobacteria bacterium]|nr:enoyl-CoA hydratase/isomerase family protein [Deltaproteobacteria bacterium]